MVEICMLKLCLPEILALFARGKKIPLKLTMPTTKLRLGKGARGSDSIADAMQDTFLVLMFCGASGEGEIIATVVKTEFSLKFFFFLCTFRQFSVVEDIC